MNRKIFMFERKPTYQEDPSFYAERAIGTVPNVFKREYTSNQTEKVDGLFTGVDITVNVPDPEPNILTKNYTSNGNDKGTGVFTGYDITINVPDVIS